MNRSLVTRLLRNQQPWLLAPLLLPLVLAACGGGGGTEPAPPNPPPATTLTVQGLAADSRAWTAASVAFLCSDGTTPRATTDAEGRYSLRLPSTSLPCLVHATASEGASLWSVAAAAGTVNVTPGSDWVVSRVLRLSTAGLLADRMLLRAFSAAGVAQGQAEVRQALAADGLVDGDLISATLAGVSDPLLASQLQVLDRLAALGVSPQLLRQALALNGDTTALREALLQGQVLQALALPSETRVGPRVPQLLSGLVSNLTGPADSVFGVNAEGSWRSTDSALTWIYVARPLTQVLRFKGLLWARDLDGVLVSGDGGLNWAAPTGAPRVCARNRTVLGTDLLWTSPEGRLWYFTDFQCTGSPDHYTDDGVNWQTRPWDGGLFRLEAVQPLAKRLPPLRQIFFRDASRLTVTSCLDGVCVDSTVLDWPYVQALQVVEGSDEVLATLADVRTGRPTSMALSPDGIRWQPMSFLPLNTLMRLAQGDLLASPGANAVADPSINTRIRRSNDDGRTWSISDPAVRALDGWLTMGAETRLRAAGANVEISTDGGSLWRAVPDIAAQRDRLSWQRAPDGSLMRQQHDRVVQASFDDGLSWGMAVAASGEPVQGTPPRWLDERWVVIGNGNDKLYTSPDGRQWQVAPLGLAGTPYERYFRSAPVSDSGVWVMAMTFTSTPNSPVLRALLESRDEGRSWVVSDRKDALASRCGELSFLWRPMASGNASEWQMKTSAEPVWRPLPLPPGVAPDTGVEFQCESGLLLVRVGGDSSAQRLPYGNAASGARGLSHWISADHGAHWTAVGRPGTDLFRVGQRWWSVGLDSVTLWP